MSESHVTNPARIFLLAMGSTVLFSFLNLGVKYAAENDIHFSQIMLFRCLIALPVVLLLISKNASSQILLHTQRPWGHLFRAIVGLGAMACFFLSFKLMPLGDATALHFAAPMILTALSVPFLGEKVGIWRWSAVIIGLVGVIIVANPTGEGNYQLGAFFAVAGAALSAVSNLMVRKMGDTEHSLTIVFYFTFAGVLVSLILCPFYWQPIETVWVFYALLSVGILGGVAQYLLTIAYAEAPAAYVSVFAYASIIFAIGFDILLWAYIPGLNVWIGSAIIVGSGLIILYREVIHKGRQARLSMYGLTPIRPTQADLEERQKTPKRRKTDSLS
jgi:drug/metabolite transporter (DMT)-like permease